MCQLTPLKRVKLNGPTDAQIKPRARVVSSTAASRRDPTRGESGLRRRSEPRTLAPFHRSRTSIPKPANRCAVMNMARSGEPDTSPRKPEASSVAMSASRRLLAQGCFTRSLPVSTRSSRCSGGPGYTQPDAEPPVDHPTVPLPSLDSGRALSRKGAWISALYPPAHLQGVFLGFPQTPAVQTGEMGNSCSGTWVTHFTRHRT